MTKNILWLLLVAVVVVGAVLVLKPELAESLVPSLWAGKHKAAVRQRATEMVGYLTENNLDGCVALTDPAFVRQHGVNGVKIRFGLLHLAAKAGKLDAAAVQLGEVRLTPDNQRAEIDMSLRMQGEWKAQNPGRWVRVDDRWYYCPE